MSQPETNVIREALYWPINHANLAAPFVVKEAVASAVYFYSSVLGQR